MNQSHFAYSNIKFLFRKGNKTFYRFSVRDDEKKARKSLSLIETSVEKSLTLYVPAIVILEIVFVLERQYKLSKREIKDVIEPILNTTQLKIEKRDLLQKALELYEEKNIKFADTFIYSWGVDQDIQTIYAYDEKDFKRIDGFLIKKP